MQWGIVNDEPIQTGSYYTRVPPVARIRAGTSGSRSALFPDKAEPACTDHRSRSRSALFPGNAEPAFTDRRSSSRSALSSLAMPSRHVRIVGPYMPARPNAFLLHDSLSCVVLFSCCWTDTTDVCTYFQRGFILSWYISTTILPVDYANTCRREVPAQSNSLPEN